MAIIPDSFHIITPIPYQPQRPPLLNTSGPSPFSLSPLILFSYILFHYGLSQYIEFFLILFIYLFIYLWLCWVFVSVRGLSLVVANGGHSSSRCAGLLLSRPLLLQSTGSRRAGSVVVAHGPSCSAACGIFPDQGSNPCPLHWQEDSQPLRHQGSPEYFFYAIQLVPSTKHGTDSRYSISVC